MERAQRIAGRRNNENRRLYQPPRHVIDAEVPLPDLEDDVEGPAPILAAHNPLRGLGTATHQPQQTETAAGSASRPATGLARQPRRGLFDPTVETEDEDLAQPVPLVLGGLATQPAATHQRTREIEDIMRNLRENHECEHQHWLYIRGPHRCEECHHELPRYIFECRQCELQACWRCRKNRL